MKFDLKIPHCSKIFWHTAWHTERLKSVKLLFYINKKWRTVRDSNLICVTLCISLLKIKSVLFSLASNDSS